MAEKRETPHQPLQKDALAREKVFLAEQASEGGIKVVPGKSWAFHYPHGAQARSAAISGLLTGQTKPEDAVGDLKPDAFTYDIADLQQQGLPATAGRVRDVSAYITYYDYPRFAQFVETLQGTGITPDTAQSLYDGIAQSRIRKKMIEAYGYTGRKQMEDALRIEVEKTTQQIGNLPGVEKVLAALKMDWLTEDLKIARTEQRDQAIGQLSSSEQQLYDQLRNAYQSYVKRGDQTSYESLVNGVKNSIQKIQQEREISERDESQEQLKEELEQYKDRAVPPVTPGDPAIPPDDSDEYHTPPIMPGESKEQEDARPYFEITPSGSSKNPLTGYYASGRKSYYDIDMKTWSKKKQLSPYNANISGYERQTISGVTNNGLKSLPLPNGYGLDLSTLKYNGAQPEIFRDQNGCFYIKTNGVSTFSVDFLKEDPLFVGSPRAEDNIPIHKGQLSSETEIAMNNAAGGSLEKAQQLRQYLLSKHFYPGDGDLQMAQSLQLKLRSESTGNNYVQNLDRSEYLECYSANTLYIAMLRKIGVPARLVIGHKVEGAKDGKARIDSQTGHAWTEVWDGNNWRRMDATPRPKQQKQDQKDDQNSPTEEAQDDGIERQDQGDSQQQDQGNPQQGQPQQRQGSQSGESTPGQQMGKASDQDISQGESQLDNAQQFSEQINQQKQNMDQKLEDAKSFQDLKKLEQEAESSDLFEDMKQDLQERLEAKEEQMKEVIKENLDEMVQDGFLDEQRRQELEKQLDETQLDELDRIRQQIEQESRLFNEYQEIKEDIMPLVDQWFDYFVERLPRQDEVELDEDSLTRQGAFNRHSVMRPRNLLFGTVKNPRIIKPSIKPKFLASIMVDVSGSMEGAKLNMARKQLVFYNELFSRISDEFGFIRYANNIFSDTIVELKTYDQDYESPTRYAWTDNTRSTIKARLMQSLHTQGGTNMLPAIQKAAAALNRETFEYPDYASAFYFIGDGQDTTGNSQKIKEFLRLTESEQGFGEHMLSAIMLGNESQRKELAAIFGDEHTTVAPNFETLIEQSMYKFDEDIEVYLADKTI